MRSFSFARWVTVCIVGIVCVGCASDPRPRYMPPGLPPSEVATIKGCWGATINEVDGARLDGPGFYFLFPSNETSAEPGVHWLKVCLQSGRMYSWYRFSCRFEKGHVYEFSPNSMFDFRLKLTDATRQESLLID